MPHIGISYNYAFAPNCSLQAAGMGVALEVNDIDGSILDADADVIWEPLRNIGIGAGYRYLRVDVDSGTSDLNGAFDLEYHGPTLYLRATFQAYYPDAAGLSTAILIDGRVRNIAQVL